MAKVRDRTEDFKDAVRHTAISLGYNESKLASILASFIIHKPRQRSSFTKAALKTLESIRTLEQFMLKHRKDYVDLHRTTEQERDSIEHEVTAFIKVCKEQIDILKNSINDEEANSKGWLGSRADNANADTIAHKHGVVLILSEKLHSVTAQFDQLRAIRFQDAINKRIPRRKLNRVAHSNSTDTSKANNTELREPDELQPEPLRVQQQLLDDETRALQVELTSLLDAAQETETKMVEMSALNHLMSTHVLQQAQQIEFLYDQAVEATKNVELGNKELSQAIQRNSSSRTFLLLFLEKKAKEIQRIKVVESDDLQNSIKLTRDNIKAIVMDVMFGGTETVASAIEWAMTELMRSPEDLKKVQQELADVVGLERRVEESDIENLTYLKCALKETLRLHPPIPLLLHETAKDAEVGGFYIPARSRVMINAWAIGRDKNSWEDPDSFKPSRFLEKGVPDYKGNNFEFIPFGSGRRSCPGMQLGLYALDLAVAHLLHCFTWELPDGMKPSELDMSDVFGLTAPRSSRLIAVPRPRLLCPLF